MGTLSRPQESDPIAAAAALTAGTAIHGSVSDSTDTPLSTNDWTPSLGKAISTPTTIVLSNLTYGFKRPNVLDIKLGSRLWADDAPLPKRQRLDEVASSTTSASLGFRVAGMKVWQGAGAEGKDGNDAVGYKVYGKDYGRQFKDKWDVSSAFKEFFSSPESAHVTWELRTRVLARLLGWVEGIKQALMEGETRMFSASVLFVYEGDGEALKNALEREAKMPLIDDQDDDDDEEKDDEDDEEGGDEPCVAVANLIDFAHAQWVPGQGPDENALQGVRSVIDILRDLSRLSSDWTHD